MRLKYQNGGRTGDPPKSNRDAIPQYSSMEEMMAMSPYDRGGSGSVQNVFGPEDYIMGAFPLARALSPAAKAIAKYFGLGKKAGKKAGIRPGSPQDTYGIAQKIQREKDWLNSDAYVSRKMDATGQSRYKVKKERDKILASLDETTYKTVDTNNPPNVMGREGKPSAMYSPSKNQATVYNPKKKGQISAEQNFDHEIKHAASELNQNPVHHMVGTGYENYPKLPTKDPYYSLVPEQQVALRRFGDVMEETIGVTRGTPVNRLQVSTVLNKIEKSPELRRKYSDMLGLLNSSKSADPKGFINNLTNATNDAWALAPIAVGAASNTSEQ